MAGIVGTEMQKVKTAKARGSTAPYELSAGLNLLFAPISAAAETQGKV